MTDFIKYSSLINHYQEQEINSFRDQIPEIDNATYIVKEKLDGANIQLYFRPNQPLKVGKRTSFLQEGESFNDIWNTLKKYQNLIDYAQKRANESKDTYRLFGEIYGFGIQRRIDYGKEKKIAIFDIMINDTYFANEEILKRFLNEPYIFTGCHARFYGMFGSLKEALEVELEPNIEGVVIKPYYRDFKKNNGDRFIIKKKSPNFEDGRKIKIDPSKKIDAHISSLNDIFRTYCNENRILDTFSKYGQIQNQNQIGDYIKHVIEDAKTDFLKTYNLNELIPNLDKNKEKKVFNVGSLIVNQLKKYL